MHEAARIFSDRKRLFLFLFMPVLCLIVFYYSKCFRYDGDVRLWKQDADVYSRLIEKYRDHSPADILNDFDQTQQYNEHEYKLLENAKYLSSYHEYLDNVREQAERLKKTSIFSADEKSYTYRNIIKTAEDFAACSADDIRLGNYTAVEDMLGNGSVDWFYLASIVFLVMAFMDEKEKMLLAVIRATPGGRGRLTAARMTILGCFSAVMTGLFYLVPLEISLMINGGREDLSNPVQSMTEMQKCTEQISVAGFIIRYLLIKAAAGFLIGMILWFIVSFIERRQQSWTTAAIFVTGEYLLYSNIQPHSVMSILRDVNVFSFLFAEKLFTEYENINVFSFPVRHGTLLVWVAVIMAVCLGTALVLLSCRRYSLGDNGAGKAGKLINTFGDMLRSRMHLYGLESYKIVFCSITGLALIACIIGTQTVLCTDVRYATIENYLYQRYINEIKGPVTEDTFRYIREAKDNLDTADMDVGDYEDALYRLEEYVSSIAEGDWVVDEIALLDIYGERAWIMPRLNSLMAAVFLTLGLSTLFTAEKDMDITRLVRSTTKGRSHLFWTKYAVALTVTLFIWYRVYCGEWRAVIAYLGREVLDAPCSSYATFRSYGSITLKQFLILLYLLKLVLMIIPVNISVFVCERYRSYEKCLLMNGLIIAIPAFIYLLHFSQISFYTPISLLADRNPLLKGTSSFVELIIWSVIGASALIWAEREWRNLKL